MGRQFSYYAYPEDLADIENRVFQRLGGTLLIAEKRDGRDYIKNAQSFPLALDRMGQESLFLLLAPPSQYGDLVFDGPWLNVSRSHLIEVGRSYINDGMIREARFWYEPTTLVNGSLVEKPQEFLHWAAQIFRLTKAQLVRHSFIKGKHEYKCWCGNHAKVELAASRVLPS